MKYYAVKEGRRPGIYYTWDECKEQVIGHKGAIYKKFNSRDDALEFIDEVQLNSIKTTEETEGVKEDEIIAYVDGSFSLELNIYSYGMVTISNQGKESFYGCGDNLEMAQMRNVSGELKGAIEAIKLALDRNKKKLYLHYDYAGIEKWAKGEWKTNKKGTKMYKDYYDKIKDRLDIEFIKVKAHSGVELNEEADLLAKKAILSSNPAYRSDSDL